MATNTEYYALIKPSLADVADIAAINQNTDKIDQIMHGSQTSLADAYDPAEIYNLHDKAMHDFQLYSCLANGTTGTWDPTKWERTTAADSGGNYVDVTENFFAGVNLADIDIDGDQHAIYAPVMEGATSEDDGEPGLVPAPTSQDVGKYLKSDGTWDDPPGGGGGGTTVIPNPQGTPTDTLNTIQIGQTVFDIPGSGGGSGSGSGLKTTDLYQYTDTDLPASITLNESWKNFDILSILVERSGNTLQNIFYLTNDLTDGAEIVWTGYSGEYFIYTLTSGTSLTKGNTGGSSIKILKIEGVKIGGVNVSEDIAAGDWTQLISQSGAAWSADTAIPAEATHIVIFDEYQNALYMPLIFRIADLDKLADVAGQNVIYYGTNWEVGNNYDKIQYKYDAANKTIAVYAVYSGITIKAYAVKAKNAAPGGSDIIPITTGDGTNSRTFTLAATPNKISLQGHTTGDGGWYESGWFIWGQDQICLYGAQGTIATGGYAGLARITYGADGKSFTITAANAFGAFNRADNMSGSMLVEY